MTGIDIQVLVSLERLNATSDLIYLHGQSREEISSSLCGLDFVWTKKQLLTMVAGSECT